MEGRRNRLETEMAIACESELNDRDDRGFTSRV